MSKRLSLALVWAFIIGFSFYYNPLGTIGAVILWSVALLAAFLIFIGPLISFNSKD